MAVMHFRAPILCAEQVEIFVPENEQIRFERVKNLLDELIFQDTVPSKIRFGICRSGWCRKRYRRIVRLKRCPPQQSVLNIRL